MFSTRRVFGKHRRLRASCLYKNRSLLRLKNLFSLRNVHERLPFKFVFVFLHKNLSLLANICFREGVGYFGVPPLLDVAARCRNVRRGLLAHKNFVNIDVGEPRMLQDSLVAVLAVAEPGRRVLVTKGVDDVDELLRVGDM